MSAPDPDMRSVVLRLAEAEREVTRLKDAEHASQRHAEMVKRNAERLAAAATAGDVARATMSELARLGVRAAKLVIARGGAFDVLASIGLGDRTPDTELRGDSPAAAAMRTNRPVTVGADGRPFSYSSVPDARETLGIERAMAWPLRNASGAVLGALSVGVADPALLGDGTDELLGTLAHQAGLALGQVFEAERRALAESELAERHRLVAELTSLVPGILYIFDVRRRRTVFINRHVSQILGYSDEEIRAFGDGLVPTLVHPGDVPRLTRHLVELRETDDHDSRLVQYRFRHRDGSWRWFESRDSVLTRGADGLVDIIGIATDVTERLQAVEAEHAVAEQNGFRAVLADALRPLWSPAEIQAAAARLLGQHLRVSRVHYSTVVDGTSAGVVEPGYADGLPSLAGRHQFDRYGSDVVDELRAGQTVSVDDVATEPRLSDAQRRETLGQRVGAYVIVPMVRDGRPVALLVVHQDRARAWAPAEIALIEETAERTRATVERAHATTALADREASYRSLFSSIDEGFCLCEIVTDESGRGVDYRFLEVNPAFEEQTGLVDPVGRTAKEMVPGLEEHWVQAVGRAALEGETVRFEERAIGLDRWFDIYASPVEPAGSGRCMIVVKDLTARRQAEATLRRNADTARRARARAELVAAVMTSLESVDRIQPLADRLVATLVPRIADYAVLEVPGRERPVLAIAHRDPELISVLRALRAQAKTVEGNSILRAAHGEPRLIADITPEMLRAQGSGDTFAALMARLAPRSHIAVPIDVAGEAGALLVGRSNPERPAFGSDDLAAAREIAERTSVRLAAARVREQEHAIGVRLQQAMLPSALPDHPAIQVAGRYQTGSELYVGGDWYDLLVLPSGLVAFAVGDVVGHGLDAAAAMSRLRIALAALAPESSYPGLLLSRLADFSAGANGVEFATAACGYLDPATGRLRYSSAGHPPTLVLGIDGQARWLDGGRSTPLGAAGIPADRPDAEYQLGYGDLVLLYSDGLIERRSEPITAGMARLESAARPLSGLPVEALCDQLLTEMSAGERTDDDAVILCLRFGPVSAHAFHRRVPAEARQLSVTRAALRTWLAGRGDSASLEQRLLLAVGEALTNAIEHADRGAPGSIDLSIDVRERDGMHVEIHDRGRWRSGPSDPARGRGLAVIGALAEQFERRSGSEGTVVSFLVPIEEQSARG